MQESLQKMMAGYSFHLAEAATGRSALDYSKKHRPDVVIVDCELPDIDCVALIKAFEKKFRDAMPAILACSSQGCLDEIGAAMNGGANECIIKPFDADVLDFKLRLIGTVKGESC